MKNTTHKKKAGTPFKNAGLVILTLMVIILPALATTQYVDVTRYSANNYSAVSSSDNLSWIQMQSSLPNIYSNGPVYIQGPTFNASDPYGITGENMILYNGHNGTYVRNLTDLVGGMAPGDEIAIQASDGMVRYFNYTNIYTPGSNQGELVLTWWDSTAGVIPDYSEGIRSFFYTPQTSYGVGDSLNFTLAEMHDSLAPWYRYNYSGTWPSAKGLSVKYVNQLNIYPPHRHDFSSTGDTSEWAFRSEVGTTLPSTANVPVNEFSSTASIADDDGIVQTDFSESMYAAHRFIFKIDTDTANDGSMADIERFSVTWNGKGWHDTGGTTNGTYLYIWDGTGYEELANNSGDGNEVNLSGEIATDIDRYANSGNITVLAVQKTMGTEENSSNIATDSIRLVVTHHHHN